MRTVEKAIVAAFGFVFVLGHDKSIQTTLASDTLSLLHHLQLPVSPDRQTNSFQPQQYNTNTTFPFQAKDNTVKANFTFKKKSKL
jgi:hypothetical protein